MMYLTLQAGEWLGEFGHLMEDQPMTLTLGPFAAFDLDYGTLTTYDTDIDDNKPVAFAREFMPPGGGPQPVIAYEVTALAFPQLAPYHGARYVRAIVHDGTVPCMTEAIALYERSSE